MLKDIYKEIENNNYNEHEISRKFQQISNDNSFELEAEIMAFHFIEADINQSNWGTYFGPFARVPQQDGSINEIPSIKNINKKTIDYWINRMNGTTNPILKARYSGLVWDFSSIVLNKKADYKIVLTYIESLIKIVEIKLQNGIDLIRKIERAYSVSLSVNNKELANKSKEVMLSLEDEIGENSKPGLWGFSFDALIKDSKSNLTKNEETTIINKLEKRLLEVTSEEEFSTWGSELIIKRLAPYYKKKNKLEESKRVLNIHGEAVKNKEKYPMLLQYQNALKDLQKLYTEYGMKQESNIILKEIREFGTNVFEEMELFTSNISISKEDIDSVVIPITSGEKIDVFNKLIHFFTPKIDLIIKSLNKHAKKYPLSNLFGKSILDETGREVANIGTLEEDLIGNILLRIAEDLQFNAFYMDKTFNRMVNELSYTLDDFVNFIKQSPVISYDTPNP